MFTEGRCGKNVYRRSDKFNYLACVNVLDFTSTRSFYVADSFHVSADGVRLVTSDGLISGKAESTRATSEGALKM